MRLRSRRRRGGHRRRYRSVERIQRRALVETDPDLASLRGRMATKRCFSVSNRAVSPGSRDRRPPLHVPWGSAPVHRGTAFAAV
jgi:hypothetical protein